MNNMSNADMDGASWGLITMNGDVLGVGCFSLLSASVRE